MPNLPSYVHHLFFGLQMFHLPSLPYTYSSVSTNLRHICKEQQICVNPFFFRPVKDAYSARMFLCRTVCHMNLALVSSAPKSLGGGGHPDP